MIALDLGGTKLLGAVVDERLALAHEVRRSVAGLGPAEALAAAAETACELLRLAPEAQAIGLAVPHPVAGDGSISFTPAEHGGGRLRPPEVLKQATGLLTAVDNDARAALLAELVAGEARGVDCVVAITVGTDIGGAVAIDGRVRSGASGFAGTVHQMVVRLDAADGCSHWGDWVNGTTLGEEGRALAERGGPSALAGRLGRREAITGRLVTDLALAGDAESIRLVQGLARRLAVGLGNVLLCLDPDLVVIAGGVSRAGSLLLDELQASLQQTLPLPLRTPIRIGRFGERAGVFGAALLALRALGRPV